MIWRASRICRSQSGFLGIGLRCPLHLGGLCLALVLSGCPHPTQLDSRLWVLEETQVERFGEEDPDRLWVQAAAGRQIRVGDVIAGERDGGFLARVQALKEEAGGLVLETEPAALSQAIREGSLAKGITFSTEDFIAAGLMPIGSEYTLSEREEVVLFRDDGVIVSIEDAVINLQPQIDVVVDFQEGKVADFLLEIRGEVALDMHLRVEVDEAREIVIEQDAFAPVRHPFTAHVGVLPVLGEAVLRFPVGIRGHFVGDTYLKTGFRVATGYQYTVRYDAGQWSDDGDFLPLEWEAHPPEQQLEVGGAIQSYCKVAVEFSLYGSLGAQAYLMPYNRLEYRAWPRPRQMKISGGFQWSGHYALGIFDERFAVRESTYFGPERVVFYWDEDM